MDKLIQLQALLNRTRNFDFLAPLALRLYLAPIFYMAGSSKITKNEDGIFWYNWFSNTDATFLYSMEDTISWFGNAEWGLGLPFPALMAVLAVSTELAGSIMLLFGFGVRWVSIPLMVTMLVAIFSVHWVNGWQAIADAKFCLFNCGDATAAVEKLDTAKNLLKEHGNYEWLTEQGSIVILNNGIEFAVTYLIMLMALFFIGGGKYASVDYWIAKKFS